MSAGNGLNLEDLLPQGQPTSAQDIPTQSSPSQNQNRPGIMKSLLTNYFQGVGERLTGHSPEKQAMLEHVNAQTKLVNAQAEAMGTSVPVTLKDGTTLHLPASVAKGTIPAIIAAQSRESVQTSKNDVQSMLGKINAHLKGAGIGVELGQDEQGNPTYRNMAKEELPIPIASKVDAAKSKIGIDIPLNTDIASFIGRPDLAGKPLSGQANKDVNTALKARGVHVVDTVGGQKIMDLFGNEVKTLGPSLQIAKAAVYAQARAENTPYSTFDDNGQPVTTTVANAIATGAPSATVWNSIYGPTGSTKTQGQASGAVASHIPTFQESVRNLAARGELGPLKGRINDYLTRGYGGNDQDISEFITDLGLIKSGAVRAHFGARGGAKILDKFDNILNTSMEPNALIGSTNEMKSFLDTYADVGTPKPPRTGVARPGTNAAPSSGKEIHYKIVGGQLVPQ